MLSTCKMLLGPQVAFFILCLCHGKIQNFATVALCVFKGIDEQIGVFKISLLLLCAQNPPHLLHVEPFEEQ